jgi:hypothetical protein
LAIPFAPADGSSPSSSNGWMSIPVLAIVCSWFLPAAELHNSGAQLALTSDAKREKRRPSKSHNGNRERWKRKALCCGLWTVEWSVASGLVAVFRKY